MNAMSSSWRISDLDVVAEIIYLDPDLTDDTEPGGGSSSKRRFSRLSISIAVILSILLSLYLIALRYWPAILRLLN